MKRFATMILVLMALASCVWHHPDTEGLTADPALAAVDSLLWTQPDSAFTQLLAFADSPVMDSLNDFNGHYFHLLLSELLYKHYYEQTNRDQLLLRWVTMIPQWQKAVPVSMPTWCSLQVRMTIFGIGL